MTNLCKPTSHTSITNTNNVSNANTVPNFSTNTTTYKNTTSLITTKQNTPATFVPTKLSQTRPT
jgi:hypothetical protein